MLLLAGCNASPPLTCAPGTGSPDLLFTLFFGLSISGNGSVTDAEWLAFVNDTVGPALPAGYTVMDAAGAWQNLATLATTHEAAKVVVVALPNTPGSLDAVQRVRTAYQRRFHQQLVGMTVQPVCAAF